MPGGLFVFTIFKRRYLPIHLVYLCLKYYENKDIFLKKNDHYKEEKANLLMKLKITYDFFEIFIENTRGNNFSNFNRIPNLLLKSNIYENFFYDFYFNQCLYLQVNLWDKNLNDKIIDLINRTNKRFLIIDLRDSNGGYIAPTIKICNLFTKDCEIVTLKYKDKRVTYLSDSNFFPFTKIFILVNEGTMSSAEILAYSLKANLKQVVLLGSKTFGKNFGQERFVNRKYLFEFNLVTFKWSVVGRYSKEIIFLPNQAIFSYIKSEISRQKKDA
jgi:hypothetical protein